MWLEAIRVEELSFSWNKEQIKQTKKHPILFIFMKQKTLRGLGEFLIDIHHHYYD